MVDNPKQEVLVVAVCDDLTPAVAAVAAYAFHGEVIPPAHVEDLESFMARGRLNDCDCNQIVCVCLQARLHKAGCFFRVALTCAIGIPCNEHHDEVCPTCYSCDCGTKS